MSTTSLVLRSAPSARSYSVHDGLLAAAMLLLPFSLGEEIVVVSYSFPVFVLLLLYYAARFMHSPTRVDPEVASVLAVSGLGVAIMIATSFFAQDPLRSLSRAAFHVNGWFILFYFCTTLTTGNRNADLERYRAFVKIFVRSGTVMAGYYIVNFAFQSFQYGVEAVIAERWTGGLASLPWGASNTVAAAVLIPFVLCLQMLAEDSSSRRDRNAGIGILLNRAEWGAYAIIMASGILLTLSRTVGAIMFIVLAFFFMRRAKVAMVLSIVLTLIGAALLTDFDLGGEIIEQRFQQGDLDTFNNRSEIWSDFWGFVTANPFGFIGFYNCLFDIGYSGHNFSLTTYVEQSFIGWFAAAALFVILLRKARAVATRNDPVDRIHGRFLLAALWAIALNLHFEDAHYTHQYITYWWVFVSLVCLRYIVAREPVASVAAAPLRTSAR
jgi:hypothetical protein